MTVPAPRNIAARAGESLGGGLAAYPVPGLRAFQRVRQEHAARVEPFGAKVEHLLAGGPGAGLHGAAVGMAADHQQRPGLGQQRHVGDDLVVAAHAVLGGPGAGGEHVEVVGDHRTDEAAPVGHPPQRSQRRGGDSGEGGPVHLGELSELLPGSGEDFPDRGRGPGRGCRFRLRRAAAYEEPGRPALQEHVYA